MRERPKLAAREELEREVQRANLLEGVVHVDDRRVLDVAQEPALDEDLVLLLVALHLLLVDHLERAPLLRRFERREDHLRVISLAEEVLDLKVRRRDVRAARGGDGGVVVRVDRLALENPPIAVRGEPLRARLGRREGGEEAADVALE